MPLPWFARLRRLLRALAGRRDAATSELRPRRGALAFAWGEQLREPRLANLAAIDAIDVSDAELRARTLLLRILAPAQRAELERRDCFTVNVPGRGRFAILPRRTLNVLNLDSGECYCCVTATDVPLSDLMLTQKLLLEHDPDRFFAAANCPSELLFAPISSVSSWRQPGSARIRSSALSALPCADRTLW